MHHRLDCVCSLCTCKLFFFCFLTDNSRNSECLSVEIVVNVEHTECFVHSLLGCFVHCVTFLPQELRSSKERTCCFLPSYNTAPLVVELWKVSVCSDNFLIMLAEKSLGGRSYAKTLSELFATAYSNPSTFRSKALNVVFFLLQKAFRNKHWHIYIFVTCFLKTSVEVSLNIFPDSITVRADNHTTLDA